MTARKKNNRKPKSSVVRNRRLARKQTRTLDFEILERRQLLAAITVSNATDILSPTADTSSIGALIANDGGDGISLREAIAAANNTAGEDAITFDAGVFTSGDNNLIRLTQGELLINDSLTIDGSSVGGVVITGDADGDDITVAGTFVTDVSASFGGVNGALDDLLDDNSRVLNSSAGSGDLTLTGLTITGGRTTDLDGHGGGIYFNSSSGTLWLIQSTVSGNSAAGSRADGGAVFSSGDVTLNNSLVGENSSGDEGGGVFSFSGNVSANNSTLTGNSSDQGGAIATFSGHVSLYNSSVSSNIGFGGGGGITTFFGEVTLTNSTVNDNRSNGSGGGVNNRSGFGDVALNNSTVSENVSGLGGGILSPGEVSLTNSTVSENISASEGGGILSSGVVSLTNSTVSGNTSSNGGGIWFDGLSLTLHNSIVADNTDNGTAPDLSVVGSLIVEHSLIGDTTGSGITFATGTGNVLNQLPLLGPLADNGGPTKTHALLSGSAAINAGNNAIAIAAGLTADQRGEDRIQLNTIDIGAFESDFNEGDLVVSTSLDVDDPNDAFTSLREAIALASERSEASAIMFDSSVFSTQTTISISSQFPTITGALAITGPGANLLTIDAQGGGDNVLDGNGFRIFEVNDGDSSNSLNVSISGLTLTGGDNSDSGGAINNFENLTLDGVAIVGNRASFGGGVSNELSGELTITNSTIANNTAGQYGGGIFSNGGELTATNVTISGNSAVGNGSAIATQGDSLPVTLNLIHSTLTSNIGNGVYFNSDNGLTLATFNNTIIDNPIVGVGNNGTTLAGGNNLFAGVDPGITGTGNLFNQISMLGPLADNGGPTLTHALLDGSPAINAGDSALAVDENGNPLTTDQRGDNRIQNAAVDIGAVESEFEEAKSLVVTTAQDIEDPSDGFISLREAIAFAEDPLAGANNDGDADGDGLVADTITFDPGVFTGGDASVIRLTQGELVISESLTIDGSSAGGVVITADAAGNDITLPGTAITDVDASSQLLSDNHRVLDFNSSGSLTLTGLVITGGASYSQGGGIRSNSGDLFLNNSTVSGNSTTASDSDASGGGIQTGSGNVYLTNSTVSENRTLAPNAIAGGGGIHATSGDVFLTNSDVSGNSTSGYFSRGGGIQTISGDLFVTNSTISGNNVAPGDGTGGGIRVDTGSLFLINSTISGNSAAFGGGIYTLNNVSLVNSTVTGNLAFYGRGGGIFFRGNDLELNNSIVAGNTATQGNPDLSAEYAVIGEVNYSLIGDTTGSGITTTTGIGNILNQPALLGPLADNGGSTLTHALLLDSPAIDAGSNALALDGNGSPLTTDQRGEARIQSGVVDVGAVEFEFENQSLIVTTRQDVVDSTDGFTSLREAIAFANDPTAGASNDGDADGDGLETDAITFDASVFAGGNSSVIRLTQGELLISENLTIDGSSVGGVVITGDAEGDDITVAGTYVTDVSASFGGTIGAPSDLLDDNSRVLNLLASGNLNLVGLTITGGRATGPGGGIVSTSANVSLTNSSVSGNSSDGAGGGIRTVSGDITLVSSTVSQNSSSFSGGGIFTGSGDLTFTNSTISGNISGSDGGGVWFDDATVLLVNSTVTGNSAVGVGGGISLFADNFNEDERLAIHNSIVAGNTDNGTAPDLLAVGDVMSDLTVEYSLIGDTTGSGVTVTTGTGNILNQSALLGPLADNGGPTFTHALLMDSPAIDTGNNALALDQNGNPLTVDQRGEARIQSGTVDIGAIEFGLGGPFLLGDVNLDGNVNFLDISPFVSLLSDSDFLNEADIDRNGVVSFLDIDPFISLLTSGGSADPFLLGDASLDGNVNFLDIAPFASLLSDGEFLNEADIDRNGVVNFLDINPFISVLSSGGAAQSNSVTSSLVAPAISVGSVPTSQFIVAEPPVSSEISLVSVSPTESILSVASTAEVLITTTSSLPRNSAVEPLPSTAPETTPLDTFFSSLVFAPIADGSLIARNPNSQGFETGGPSVATRAPTRNVSRNDLPHESRHTTSSANVMIENYFSIGAELFDANLESLDEIFEFQFEETFAALEQRWLLR